MDYLPLFFQLRGSPVLLVGGGRIALRKARLLCRAKARLTVVAPDIEAELVALLESSNGTYIQRQFSIEQIETFSLVVAATPDTVVNKQVSVAARAANIPVNVVDAPELSSVIFPAIVDRNPVLVAIGSGGRSPVLVRRVRSQIEALLPMAIGRVAEFVGRWRARVTSAVPDVRARRRFWEALLDSQLLPLWLATDNATQAEDLLQQHLDQQAEVPTGEVYLLGAGPGDAELVSFKTARLLQAADVVLYDRLVSPEVLELARRDAELIYVGKQRADHRVPQQDINELLLKLALDGNRVARLKGGDPFIFGRGGEEIEKLAEARIPFQVVPGVTAASGCASYAGIPLTHRDHAQSVRFVTGHLRANNLELPWADLCNPQETLVFYMSLHSLDRICEQLQAHGRAADTPVALIEQGTTRQQRTIVASLGSLAEKLAGVEVHAPTLFIVGSVVELRKKLQWYGEQSEPGRWPPPHGAD